MQVSPNLGYHKRPSSDWGTPIEGNLHRIALTGAGLRHQLNHSSEALSNSGDAGRGHWPPSDDHFNVWAFPKMVVPPKKQSYWLLATRKPNGLGPAPKKNGNLGGKWCFTMVKWVFKWCCMIFWLTLNVQTNPFGPWFFLGSIDAWHDQLSTCPSREVHIDMFASLLNIIYIYIWYIIWKINVRYLDYFTSKT